jgi:hypothetical protein
MQVAILDNAASASGLERRKKLARRCTARGVCGLSDRLSQWAFGRGKSLPRDGYLFLYCVYIAGFFAWAFSVWDDLVALAYVLPVVAFGIDRLIMATHRG